VEGLTEARVAGDSSLEPAGSGRLVACEVTPRRDLAQLRLTSLAGGGKERVDVPQLLDAAEEDCLLLGLQLPPAYHREHLR